MGWIYSRSKKQRNKEKEMNIKKLIKRWWPSRKFILSGGVFFGIRWVLSVLFFDILNWPAWFWSIIISAVITVLANVVYVEWVYKENGKNETPRPL